MDPQEASAHGSHEHGMHDPSGGGHDPMKSDPVAVQGKHAEADVHGMLIVGSNAIFLSHFPMFNHAHHDMQVILEVRLSAGATDPERIYAADRERSGQPIYSIRPEMFFLPDIGPGEDGHTTSNSFKATIIRGHFEREQTRPVPILEGVEVTVVNRVHFRRFDPQAPTLSELTYILFGRNDELFLAHLITGPPDFDQVLSVRIDGIAPGADELRTGILVTIPGRRNRAPARLRTGQSAAAQLVQSAGAASAGAIQLTGGIEWYFCERELGEAFSTVATPEEIEAGFG